MWNGRLLSLLFNFFVCVLRVWDDYFHAKKRKENSSWTKKKNKSQNKQQTPNEDKVQLTRLTLFSLTLE